MLVRAVLTAVAALGLASPAFARDTYVYDGAKMIGPATVSDINSEVGAFNARTGKEVVVVTVPTLDGATLKDAAERAFAARQVNGVLIFLAQAEKQGGVLPDQAARTFFPAGTAQNIYDGMRGYLRSGDVDAAVKTGVNLTLDQYRSHEGALGRRQSALAPVAAGAPKAAALPLPEQPKKSSFGGIGLFWFLVLLVVGFFVIRAIFRAMSGPRQVPPGYQGPMPGPGGPMPGPGYGYGPGYGQQPMMGGGGGGFMSGLLGGLGGAFIGNQLFGRRDEGGFGGNAAGFGGDQNVPTADASGWQSDAGQADTSGFGGGGWGDSGGGGADFGSGDFGGGGGGDGGW